MKFKVRKQGLKIYNKNIKILKNNKESEKSKNC